MKRKLVPVLVVLLLIFVVGAAGVITHLIRKYTPTQETMSPEEYYGMLNQEEVPVMIDTEILEERGVLRDGNVYLPLDLVHTYLNERFYWDEEAGALLYSTTEETLREEPEEGSGARVIEWQGQICVDIAYIGEHTDLEYTVWEEPARLVIHKSRGEYHAGEAKESTEVRYQGGIKSPILTSLAAGDPVSLLETYDNWVEVATQDGFVGYAKIDAIEDLGMAVPERAQKEEAEFEQLALEEPVNLVWHQVTSKEANATLKDAVKKMTGVNVISPTWFSIRNEEGKLTSLADADYVNQAHAMGLEVWALIDNFDEDIRTEEVLSRESARTRIIETLVKEAVNCGIDGINVDFETMSEEAIPHFLQFLRELSIETHKNNLVLSVDDPVPEGYTVYYNRAEQGRVADYLIIMGYDEHYLGDTEAGSVASLPWVEQGIKDTLEEVPAEKVINGIPLYTRIWRTSAGIVSSEAVGMTEAAKFIKEHKIETYWDKTTSQNYGSVDVGNDTYEVWLEDADSIAEKMKLIGKYDLAGVASWKLGLESSKIWKVISSGLEG